MFSISLDCCEIKENQAAGESFVINGMIREFYAKLVMSFEIQSKIKYNLTKENPKNKILLAYMKIDQKAVTEQIKIENTIKKKRLQTRIPIQERPTLPIEDTLKATHNSPVTVTMMNGQRIEGKLTQYDKYNLVVNIKDMPVLLYRHAIYQFQDITQIPTYTYREGKDVDAFIQKILKDFILTKELQLTIIYKGIKETEAEQITKQLQTHIPNANIERRYI